MKCSLSMRKTTVTTVQPNHKHINNSKIRLFLRLVDNPQPLLLKESALVSLKGSLSLEAGMVIPIFLFFMMTIILGIEMVRLQTNVFEALHEEYFSEYVSLDDSSKGRFYEYLESKENVYLCTREPVEVTDNSDIDTLGKIDIGATYEFKPFISLIPIGILPMQDRVFGHAFCGYKGPVEGTLTLEKDEYVYITKTGAKYHRSADCSYLNTSVRPIPAESVDGMRNSSGGKYYPCSMCDAVKSGVLYITDDGTAYHSSAMCMALKRIVRIVTLKEAKADGYTPCSKCG